MVRDGYFEDVRRHLYRKAGGWSWSDMFAEIAGHPDDLDEDGE
jgi:hypothetical protein